MLHLAAIGDNLAFIEHAVAHQTLHERALARAVFAKQRVNRAGLDLDRDFVERAKRAERLARADHCEALRACEALDMIRHPKW